MTTTQTAAISDTLRVLAGYVDKFGLSAPISIRTYMLPVRVLVSPEDLGKWRSALDLCNQPEWEPSSDGTFDQPKWDDADYGDIPFHITTVRYVAAEKVSA